MKKLLSTFIFPIIVFLTLIASVFSFLYFFKKHGAEVMQKVYEPSFLTGESLSLFLINVFIYLLLFNLWSLTLNGKENKKEKSRISLKDDAYEDKKKKKETYKKRWQTITEILEEKSHHSLLNEFKIHDLRTTPYMKESLSITLESSFKLNKIITIYHKIYNTIMPLKYKKSKTNIHELMLFLRNLIENLQKANFEILLTIVKKIWIDYVYFLSIALFTFSIFSYWIGSWELFYMNLFVLLSIFILLSITYAYFEIKKRIYTDFIFSTSYFSHYLNKFTFVSIAFLLSISSLLLLKHTIFNCGESFNHYNDLSYTFGKLLLPSSFETILDKSTLCSPFEILVYKLIFIFILGYIVFSTINFAIKKYDSIYFSNTKKTLMPPELATLSINFLLVISFLSLLYGTFFNYIHVMDYSFVSMEMQKFDHNITQVVAGNNNTGEMTDYIPFSIFIAIVGGLLTMATKDLLENYFAGLSLQMDSPYEEHDRVTIDGSEMLEVRHIGIRADKFYGIKSNAEIIIPHQQIIKETIINYTLPTLDYREEISIYIPQVNNVMENEYRSIPKRAEMLLLLSIYVNTGVKIPFLQIKGKNEENSLLGLDIGTELKEFKAIANKYMDKQLVREKQLGDEKSISHAEYKTLIETEKNCIEKIWVKLKEENKSYETNKFDHPLSKLFIHHLVETVETAISDKDQNNEPKEKKIIFKIKSIVASILLSIDDYQEKSTLLHHHIDKNFAIRKYRMFRENYTKDYEENSIQDMANELVHINYYYFILADSLWKLKNLQNSLYRKREVDATSIELLDVPRVTTEHIYSGEGKINYWKVTANITLELAEQSNEIIHHIHMYVDNLWNDFNLPKYYEVRDS